MNLKIKILNPQRKTTHYIKAHKFKKAREMIPKKGGIKKPNEIFLEYTFENLKLIKERKSFNTQKSEAYGTKICSYHTKKVNMFKQLFINTGNENNQERIQKQGKL